MCFTDNCSGMTDIAKVVSTIGNSDKRNTFVTNGQFGLIYNAGAVNKTFDYVNTGLEGQMKFFEG